MGKLDGKVALVTGASKNIGKGMAIEVGAEGAVTYLAARTLPEQTAKEIEARGGTAIPLECDVTDIAQIEAVFDRIQREQGRLDLVVNVASPDFSEMVGKPFWETGFEHMTACLEVGPRSNYVTTALAARMMVPAKSGVVINISSHGAESYLLSTPYGVGKAAIDRVTRDTAMELKPHGVAVVSLWPGLVLTERIMSQAEIGEDGKPKLHGLDIDFGETPKFNGKGVVALAADPDIMKRTGGSFFTATLAREYGFTEDDGHLPPEMTNGLGTLMGADDIPDFWRGVERYVEPNPA